LTHLPEFGTVACERDEGDNLEIFAISGWMFHKVSKYDLAIASGVLLGPANLKEAMLNEEGLSAVS